LAGSIDFFLPCQEEKNVAWRFIDVNLHDAHESSIKIIRFWLLSIEDLYVVGSTRNAEDFAVEEVA
jgi:hypothetical protein